jgi:hypothetical protein
MADGLTSTGVRGLEELLRRLDRLPLGLAREVARPALEEAGEIIQAGQEADAPRKSGELAEDIIVVVTVAGDLRTAMVRVGPGYPGPAGLRTRKRGRYAGQSDRTTSPAVYDLFVERGHGMPGYSWASRFGSAKQRRRTGRQVELGSHDVPPHPWMERSFDGTRDPAIDALARHTGDALNRVESLVS